MYNLLSVMNRQAINQLINALAATSLSGKKKKGKKKRKSASQSLAAVVPRSGAMMPGTSVQGGGRRRKRRQQVGAGMSDGTLRLRRTCMLDAIRVVKGKTTAAGSVQINVRNLPWVKKIASAYDRVHYNAIHIEYRTAVGTTVNGMVAYGFDWSNKTASPADRAAVQGYSPFRDHAVWACPGPMVLEPSKLNAMQWYQLDIAELCAPGYLNWFVNAGTGETDLFVGELYVTIDATFTGCVP